MNAPYMVEDKKARDVLFDELDALMKREMGLLRELLSVFRSELDPRVGFDPRMISERKAHGLFLEKVLGEINQRQGFLLSAIASQGLEGGDPGMAGNGISVASEQLLPYELRFFQHQIHVLRDEVEQTRRAKDSCPQRQLVPTRRHHMVKIRTQVKTERCIDDVNLPIDPFECDLSN